MPVSLSTRDHEQECIDYYLTQMNEPLLNFLTFTHQQGMGMVCDQELKVNYANKDELQREEELRKNQTYRIPSLRDYEMIKVLGTGGFS